VDVSTPGWGRRRRGRGFGYHDCEGRPITDPVVIERLRALAIPPAWTDVWICPHPGGQIQAVGTDAAGRRQYLYHEQWRALRDEQKYDRALRLGARLPRLRGSIGADLARPGLGRERVLAAALRMLDLAVLRTGNDEYAPSGDDDDGTFGLTTLRCEHARVRGGTVLLEFEGKGGVRQRVALADRELHRVVVALRRGRDPAAELLGWRGPQGWRDMRADDVNARLKELAGDEFTAKDLRTWSATVLAAVSLAARSLAEQWTDSGVPPAGVAGVVSGNGRSNARYHSRTRGASQRAVAAAMREVAEHLGNTPAVARRSYVDPRVLACFERGTTVAAAVRRAGSADLSDGAVRATLERATLRMLRVAG
jgi:DNA topoisomerase IB